MNWWGVCYGKEKRKPVLRTNCVSIWSSESPISDVLASANKRPDERCARNLQVKEDCSDARGTLWLEDFGQDARYACRQLAKNKAFAVVVILIPAIGIHSQMQRCLPGA